MGERPPGPLNDKLVRWTRAYDAFGDNYRLFGTEGITPYDVIQGAIGDCWFMSAASAMAEVPGRMEAIFLNKSEDDRLNKAGVYAVNFYTLGVPHTVVIDDHLPLMPSKPQPKPLNNTIEEETGQPEVELQRTLFARAGVDGSLWGAFLEKAFAKYHGNFKHIEGGDPRKAVLTLYGSPFVTYQHHPEFKFGGTVEPLNVS